MQIKTITTVAGVNEIDFGNDDSQTTAHFYWFKNLSNSTLYVSAVPDPVAGEDNVAELSAKGAASVETDEGKVYVLGAGKVEVHRTNSKFCPFELPSTGSGGGGGGAITVDSELSETSENPLQNKATTAAINEIKSELDTKSDVNHIHDITVSGNPVQLDGLQGGVPFSEMVVSGKNLLKYPYASATKNENGITFTDNGDGTIIVDGTATADAKYYLSLPIILSKGNYTIGFDGQDEYCYCHVYLYDTPYTTMATSNTKPNFVITENTKLTIRIVVKSGKSFSNFLVRPQLELGTIPTDYEPLITGRELTVNVNGTDYTITPDTNPYIIPNDIRQQDGLNNISVSEGELSVVGVRKNAAIKRIWDNMGMDLLFDGLAIESSPATGLDFDNYDKYLINCYNAVTSSIDYCCSIIVERDRLEYILSKGQSFIHSIGTTYTIGMCFSGTIDNATYYAKQTNIAEAPYSTRIYGIK